MLFTEETALEEIISGRWAITGWDAKTEDEGVSLVLPKGASYTYFGGNSTQNSNNNDNGLKGKIPQTNFARPTKATTRKFEKKTNTAKANANPNTNANKKVQKQQAINAKTEENAAQPPQASVKPVKKQSRRVSFSTPPPPPNWQPEARIASLQQRADDNGIVKSTPTVDIAAPKSQITSSLFHLDSSFSQDLHKSTSSSTFMTELPSSSLNQSQIEAALTFNKNNTSNTSRYSITGSNSSLVRSSSSIPTLSRTSSTQSSVYPQTQSQAKSTQSGSSWQINDINSSQLLLHKLKDVEVAPMVDQLRQKRVLMKYLQQTRYSGVDYDRFVSPKQTNSNEELGVSAKRITRTNVSLPPIKQARASSGNVMSAKQGRGDLLSSKKNYNMVNGSGSDSNLFFIKPLLYRNSDKELNNALMSIKTRI